MASGQSSHTPAIEVSTVNVIGSRANAPFQKPFATSHRDNDVLGQDINTIIRTMPGTFTQHDLGQGGFAVNIRGLEGFGRVNTTIDGVSQTFYQANPAHGWNGSTTYIDENFISSIDVNRGAVSGASGINALTGSAEFRTIGVDDLVAEGKNFGVKTTYRRGSNGYGKNGMIGIGSRLDLDNGGSVGFISAISGKRKYGYKNGAGELIAGDDFNSSVAAESGSKSWGTLNKIQIKPNSHHSFTLSHLYNRARFLNNHSPLEVKTQMGLLKYRYNPLSDWVDLHADIAYSEAKQNFLSAENSQESYVGRTTRNPALSLVLKNQTLFDVGGNDLSFNYGTKITRVRYNSNHSNKSLLVEGQQNLDSAFIDANWQPGKWILSAGIHYERYGLRGYLPPTDDNGSIILPKGGNIHFNRKENHVNPRIGISYKPLDWLELYTNIGKSSRSPNVQEFMYVNNNKGNPYSVNPYLKGESSFNRDLGFNIFKQGLFAENDTLRMKVNYFNNQVKNYILQDQFYVCGNTDLSRCSYEDYFDGTHENRLTPIGVYRNIPDTTHMRGWELEGGYDFGRAYVNMSWSKTRTDFPPDYLSALGISHIRTQPESVWMIDAGTRWLNNRLIVGWRISFTGKDSVAGETDIDTDIQAVNKVDKNPKLFDLYAIYKASKNLSLFLNIDNVTNRVYNYPLSGGTLATGNLGPDNNANSGTGRGRTIYGGLTLKF
ncbi:MAG: TonB-dependent receptor [Neisseria sp.]|uniref:TonB-dependent receptor domain-containing protein n=1 Tax=Neisseria sp. TaxID=192066 RepID=UPI0026DC7556|nr:TonB-dependent receptor [Neisseria sp.]MDO4640616.1 TonB-dependent receptor [Neisseria sp.]